jgi:hypothetical protein
LAVSASHAAKAKKVDSLVEIDAWYYPPPDEDWTLFGDVHARKSKSQPSPDVDEGEREPPKLPGAGV